MTPIQAERNLIPREKELPLPELSSGSPKTSFMMSPILCRERTKFNQEESDDTPFEIVFSPQEFKKTMYRSQSMLKSQEDSRLAYE